MLKKKKEREKKKWKITQTVMWISTPARTDNPQNTLLSKKISYNLTAFRQQYKAFHKKVSE